MSGELRERWTEAIGAWNDEWDDFLAVDMRVGRIGGIAR